METYPEAGIKLHPVTRPRCSRASSREPPSGSGRRSPTTAAGEVQLRCRDSLRLDTRIRVPSRGAGVVEIAEGENLEVDPPRRLVQTFTALWSEDVKREGPSRMTWEIEPVRDSCRLTVTHDQLNKGANGEPYGGWSMILSGLKTLPETGNLLTTPGSLRIRPGR